jgi:hypothetical protein
MHRQNLSTFRVLLILPKVIRPSKCGENDAAISPRLVFFPLDPHLRGAPTHGIPRVKTPSPIDYNFEIRWVPEGNCANHGPRLALSPKRQVGSSGHHSRVYRHFIQTSIQKTKTNTNHSEEELWLLLRLISNSCWNY